MRLFVLTLAFSIAAGFAVAQTEPDLGPEAEPPSADDLHALPDLEVEDEAKVVGDGTADGDALDPLFQQLAAAQSKEEAEVFARQIQRAWMVSGSDTVDVLMTRAGEAMRASDHALALDLLDVIVTLKPDYAEGWNRRATVFYMREDFGRSLADIERTLALEPRHWGALSGLAIIQRRIGRDLDALANFKKVLKIHPGLENAQEAVDDLQEKADGEPI